jgi:hypothetical protein
MADEILKHPDEVYPLTLNCESYNGVKLHTVYIEVMDKRGRHCDLVVSDVRLTNDGKSITFMIAGGMIDRSPYLVCCTFTGRNGMTACWELKVRVHPRIGSSDIVEYGGEPGSGTRLIRFRKNKNA